jgi:hypothetical protein
MGINQETNMRHKNGKNSLTLRRSIQMELIKVKKWNFEN